MTVLEIMLHLTADVVGSAYVSNSPLLIRVRLWSYAFEKVRGRGRDRGVSGGGGKDDALGVGAHTVTTSLHVVGCSG